MVLKGVRSHQLMVHVAVDQNPAEDVNESDWHANRTLDVLACAKKGKRKKTRGSAKETSPWGARKNPYPTYLYVTLTLPLGWCCFHNWF
jgi:hypothetical protein